MEFSIRDRRSSLTGAFANQRGQGIVEYILILVVVVALILGGLHKFNSAFREYAMSYFGDYLSCLLETGELPTIGGTPGDSGVCNTLFKPFTLADGWQLKGGVPESTSNESGGRGSGASERGALAGGRGGSGSGGRSMGGGGGSFSGGGRFGRIGGRSSAANKSRVKGKAAQTYTGSTSAESYGGSYGATNRKLDTGVKHRLDNRFAFEDEKEEKQKRKVASSGKKSGEESQRTARRSRLKASTLKQDAGQSPDSGMSFPDFMRYLIIAGILIALFLFLGGQMLQIGKSMD